MKSEGVKVCELGERVCEKVGQLCGETHNMMR